MPGSGTGNDGVNLALGFVIQTVRPGGGGGGGGGFYPTHSWGWGATDQFRGIPIIGRLLTNGTRGPEEKGYSRIWPDAEGLVQGSRARDVRDPVVQKPQLLHEGVSARPTLWR